MGKMNMGIQALPRMALGIFALCSASHATQAQTYPDKPIKLIIGFAPGGIADSIGRIAGQIISESLKQPVIAENRAGASSIIAARAVIAAPADGYTLLVSTTAMPINEAAGTAQGIALGKDLIALSISAVTPELLAVAPNSPVKLLKELIASAKQKNGIAYATAGAGTASHIAAEYLFKTHGINASHVPHKGGAPALNAVTGGHIELLSISMPSATAHVRAGTLRGIAVGAPQRSPALPDVPSGAEQGMPEYDFTSWVGFFAAPGIPAPVAALLNSEINKALQNPDMRARMTKMGFNANIADLPATAKMLDAEVAKWTKAVKVAGFGQK